MLLGTAQVCGLYSGLPVVGVHRYCGQRERYEGESDSDHCSVIICTPSPPTHNTVDDKSGVTLGGCSAHNETPN